MSRINRALFGLLCWSPVVVVLSKYTVGIVKVHGRSMQSTLNPDSNKLKKDVLLVEKYSIEIEKEYNVGDVVVLKSPDKVGKWLVKRIVGLEGDLIVPKPLRQRSQPAHSTQIKVNEPPQLVIIPEGHCWVEGDDGFHSNDSNSFGPVPLALVQSRAIWILYPFNRFGPLPSPPPFIRKYYDAHKHKK